ncbi:MAG: 2-5 ligase [Phycisphaerales bacterium]|nr:2-5 ligase [Phycisphaerales bacterium]
MRLFLAIPLPDAARDALAAAVARAEADEASRGRDPLARWVRPDNLHVTLRFLGDVDEPMARAIAADLLRLPRPGVIELHADGPLFFPPRGSVRVIAAGLGGDVDRVGQLHAGIAAVCDAYPVERDDRPYRPHVTLGRARRGVSIDRRRAAGLPGIADLPRVAFAAAEFVLYESRLLPGGPAYAAVERFPVA